MLDAEYGEYKLDDEYPYPDGAYYFVVYDTEFEDDPAACKTNPIDDGGQPYFERRQRGWICRLWASSEEEAIEKAKAIAEKDMD